MVKHPQWVIRVIPHGGPIELFLIPTTTGVTKAMDFAMLSVGWCL